MNFKNLLDYLENRSNATLPADITETIDRCLQETRNLKTGGYVLPYEQIFSPVEQRTMTTGAATAGGNFVGSSRNKFFTSLPNSSFISKIPQENIYTGLNSDYGIPFGSGFEAYWLGETAQATSDTPTINLANLKPFRLAVEVPVSRRLYNQGGEYLKQYLRTEFEKAIQYKIEKAILDGAGTTEPTGFDNLAGVNITTGISNSITFDDLFKCEENIINAGGITSEHLFVFNGSTTRYLRNLQFDGGSGVTAINNSMAFSNVLGYQYRSTPAAAANRLFFFNPNYITIGFYGDDQTGTTYIDFIADTFTNKSIVYVHMAVYVGIGIAAPTAHSVLRLS